MASKTTTGSVSVRVEIPNSSQYEIGTWNYEITISDRSVYVTVRESGGGGYIGSVSITYNGQTQTTNANGVFSTASANFYRESGANTVTLSGLTTGAESIKFDQNSTNTTTWTVEFEEPNAAPTVTFGNLPTLYAGQSASINWTTSDAEGDTVKTTKLVRYTKASGASAYTAATLINNSSGTTSKSYTDTIPESAGGGTVYYEVTVTDGYSTATAQSPTKSVSANQPPTISGSDSNLGTFSTSKPTYSYTVNDPDGNSVTVSVSVDGKEKSSFTATLGQSYSVTFTDSEWLKTLNGTHTITITATDSKGASVNRTVTFTKNVTSLSFTLATPLDADAQITKAIETLTASIPEGAMLTVEVCNNGYDSSPTWEDVTDEVLNREKIFLQNTSKTASKWGYNVRVTISRNSATGECWAFSMAGYFE